MTAPDNDPGPSPPALLLDENLSPQLARRLADVFPGSVHVAQRGLARADDEQVWLAAAAGGFMLVTKDDDFRQRSFLRGAPPKVVWLRLGNVRTREIEATMRKRLGEILAFAADEAAALLVISATREGPDRR